MTRVIIPGVTHMAITNNGDGSSGAVFFSSQKTAEAYMKEDNERFCDDILDISRGIEIDPQRWEWRKFQKVVADFTGIMYSEPWDECILLIAEHFECGTRTVKEWGLGKSRPHLELREQVEKFIQTQEGK